MTWQLCGYVLVASRILEIRSCIGDDFMKREGPHRKCAFR